ncbi:MAG: YfhO family protein, partial [Clostridiales bacterium]|nr:YfhO family protein [Clostridiales bacterium]
MIEKKTLEKKAGNHKQIDCRPLLAFFLTMLAMVTVFSINMIIPFGGRSVLTSDLAAQYGPYLIGLKKQLLSGQSLFYNRSLGLGANTMGVFGYYLSSPLNLIVLIFPTSMIQEMVALIIIVKLSFAGAFMTWLLDRKFKSDDKMSILFGMMYPLCSFAIIYMFNIMWLDGFAILPLLILLTEKFIDNKRTWPVLTIVLLVLFVSGYYMAYMVGVFS